MFQQATRHDLRLRMALYGPAKSGKTFSALRIAFSLAGPTGTVAVINTESKAIEKYIGLAPDGIPFQFMMETLTNFDPDLYTRSIIQAGQMDATALIIDSLSHAWSGAGGALQQVDNASGNNKFSAWKNVTPKQHRLVEAIMRSPCHVIATMRSKMGYDMERNEKGKVQPVKVGLQPEQRSGMEYEFDITGQLDLEHNLTIDGSRCPHLPNGSVFKNPGAEVVDMIKDWLSSDMPTPQNYYATNEAQLSQPTNVGPAVSAQPGNGSPLAPTSLVDRAVVERIGGYLIRIFGDDYKAKAQAMCARRGITSLYQMQAQDAQVVLERLMKEELGFNQMEEYSAKN